jgi:hypothetical protein
MKTGLLYDQVLIMPKIECSSMGEMQVTNLLSSILGVKGMGIQI